MGVTDADGGAPGSRIGNGAGRPPHRRPPLRITGEVFSWEWIPGRAACFGCGSALHGEGYGGSARSTWGEHEPVPLLAFCEPCALQRAQGSVGVAVLEGDSHRCTVRSWDSADPEHLVIALDDVPPTVRQHRDRLVTRRVPVHDFRPERSG